MKESILRIMTRFAFIFAFISSPCWAGYYSVLDNAEILSKGTYKLMGDAQFLTNQDGGINVGATIDAGFQDEFGARALIGFGKTDYFMGGMFKWIPIPDVEGQPAVGFNLGLLYGRWHDTSELTFRGEPLVSKKLGVGGGFLTPYASIPINIRMRNSNTHDSGTDVAWQLAAGSQLQVERWKNIQFIGEIGIDLSNAFSYVNLGAIWYFDDQNGFQVK